MASRTCSIALLLVAVSAACGDGDPGSAGDAGDAGPVGREGDRGVVGEAGDEGDTPASPELVPSLSACFPAALYLGHPQTITISGQDTSFTDPVLELGDGIAVSSMVVASATAIVADVAVDLEAEIGAIDLAVNEGGVAHVLAAALEVLPSLEVVSTSGTLANGSSFLVDLAATDPAFPLDEATLRASLSDVEGLAVQVVAVEPWNVRLRVSTDVGVDDLDVDVVVESGDEDEVLGFRAPDAFAIVRRDPVELDLAAPPVGVDAPGGSHLYALDPPATTSKVVLSVVATGGAGTPRLVVLPASGRVTDFVAVGTTTTFIAAGEGPYYVVVIDDSAADDYTYDLTATVTPSPAPETEPNDTCGDGDAVASFPTSLLGALEAEDDVDWYAVTLGDAQDGMRLRSRTVAGDALTDVEVTVFDADCTTVLVGPRDIDLHENVLSDPLPAGVVHVRVRASQTFPYQGSFYELTFNVEP